MLVCCRSSGRGRLYLRLSSAKKLDELVLHQKPRTENEITLFGRRRLTDVSPKPTDACGSNFAALFTGSKSAAHLPHRLRTTERSTSLASRMIEF